MEHGDSSASRQRWLAVAKWRPSDARIRPGESVITVHWAADIRVAVVIAPFRLSIIQGSMRFLNVPDTVTFGSLPESVIHSRSYYHCHSFVGAMQRVSIPTLLSAADSMNSSISFYSPSDFHQWSRHGAPAHLCHCQSRREDIQGCAVSPEPMWAWHHMYPYVK